MQESKKGIDHATRCLVLGGRGFIGSHLVSALLERGFQVRCFDRPHVRPIGDDYLHNPCFELCEGDFTSDSDVAAALSDCDICFHLVSTTLPKSSNADPVFDVESNVVATIRLLNHAVEKHVKKVIFVSSGGTVYGRPVEVPMSEGHPTDPLCSYGISKLAIEKYLGLFHHLHGLDYTVLRLANPFGEGQRTVASQGVVAVFLGKALRGEPVEIWGDGSVVRDYIYISDVIDALMAVMGPQLGSHIFNIGSGCGLSVNEVLNKIEEVTQRTIVRKYMEARAFDVPANVLCIRRAFESFGWAPRISFASGIERFAKWMSSSDEIVKG